MRLGVADWKAVWDAIYPWIVAFYFEPHELPGLIASAFEKFLKFLIVIAVIMTVRRAKLLKELMVAFNEGRGRIWDLKNTVADLQRLEPVMKSMADRFERLSEVVEVIKEQNVEAQLESSVERTDNGVEDAPNTTTNGGTVAQRARIKDDANWTKLRRLYLRNARRLQAKVDSLPDGRTRNSYYRIGWKRPRLIVQKLVDDQVVTGPVGKASLSLIEEFNAYKSRHSAVPDEVIGAMEVLDRQLEVELGAAPPDEELT